MFFQSLNTPKIQQILVQKKNTLFKAFFFNLWTSQILVNFWSKKRMHFLRLFFHSLNFENFGKFYPPKKDPLFKAFFSFFELRKISKMFSKIWPQKRIDFYRLFFQSLKIENFNKFYPQKNNRLFKPFFSIFEHP